MPVPSPGARKEDTLCPQVRGKKTPRARRYAEREEPMKKIKRMTNDLPVTSIRQMMEASLAFDPERIAYVFKQGTGVRQISMREFYNDVENLGAALTDLGFADAHIACVGENNYPWIRVYLTALMSAGVFVPLDRELPAKDLVYLVNDSDATVVFCDEKREAIFREHREEMPAVKKFVTFGREIDEDDFLSFGALCARGARLDRGAFDALVSDPDACKDLVYTSGTTGVAKGVMLTEHNLCSSIYYGMQVSQLAETGLSVLPFHHTYEAVCDILVAIHSHTTLYLNDSLKYVQKNLKFFRPECVCLVPAFAEHFYNVIQAGIRKEGKEKQFFRACRLSRALRRIGIDLRPLLFRRLREELGGNLSKIVCGGAPIRPEIGAFFDDIGISLTGGYGITECSPLVSVNDQKDNNFSSAGHRLACLSWRIDHSDAEGVGEICVKGDVVMKGYYKRPDLTAEAIRDGWFYTGDYGKINENDEVVITGRKKNIIVLNNGKNIYPEEIEGYIGNLPGVTEVVVSGIRNEHGQDVGLSAEVYSEENVSETVLLSLFRRALSHLPSYKQISRVTLRRIPFVKTTTQKIRRGA